MIEVTEVSIAELRDALESGRTTAVELVQAYLARIDAYDAPGTPTALNAVVVRNPDALAEAQASDARRARGETLGPLDGIPYTARTATWSRASPRLPAARRSRTWWPSAMPSPSSACAPPGRSAWARPTCRPWPTAACSAASTAARRAVQCRLPHRALRLGVLNGAGTATAASFAAFGLAEETWSSGRGPASNNGLCAYTPSRGVISVRGNWPLTPTMDVVVPYARSMADLLEILDVVVADDPDTRGDLWRMQPWVPIPKASEVRPASYPALAAGAGPWPASASACRACSSTPTPMRAPASPRDRRPDRPAHPYPALGHRPLGTGAQGPGSRRRRSDRGGLPAGVELRGRPTRRAHRVQPRPGVEGIPPRRAVGTLGLGLRRLPARQWRSEAEPPGGCRRPADLPHDPGTLPNREGDLAAGMDEYVRMAERGIKPWDRIATLPDGLRGLEETRRIDLEEWMRRLRLDAVLFPTVADVDRRTPTSTRPRPTSPGATVSGSPTATSPSATSACRRSPYRWG